MVTNCQWLEISQVCLPSSFLLCVCVGGGSCLWQMCSVRLEFSHVSSWLPISDPPSAPFPPPSSAGMSQNTGEQDPLWKIRSAVLVVAMTHHSDIIQPSAPTEPMRDCLGSDSSIRPGMHFEKRPSKDKSRTMITPFSWQLLKACLAAWRICWWINCCMAV